MTKTTEHNNMMINPLTLELLITKLESVSQNKKLILDFDDQSPLDLDSWRTVYANLAIGYNPNVETTVEDFLLECKATVGKTLYGFTGGEYIMNKETPIFVDNWGECSICQESISKFRALINIIEYENYVLMVTEWINY